MSCSLGFFSSSLLLLVIRRNISIFALSTKGIVMHKSQFGWTLHGLRKKSLKFLLRVLFLLPYEWLFGIKEKSRFGVKLNAIPGGALPPVSLTWVRDVPEEPQS